MVSFMGIIQMVGILVTVFFHFERRKGFTVVKYSDGRFLPRDVDSTLQLKSIESEKTVSECLSLDELAKCENGLSWDCDTPEYRDYRVRLTLSDIFHCDSPDDKSCDPSGKLVLFEYYTNASLCQEGQSFANEQVLESQGGMIFKSFNPTFVRVHIGRIEHTEYRFLTFYPLIGVVIVELFIFILLIPSTVLCCILSNNFLFRRFAAKRWLFLRSVEIKSQEEGDTPVDKEDGDQTGEEEGETELNEIEGDNPDATTEDLPDESSEKIKEPETEGEETNDSPEEEEEEEEDDEGVSEGSADEISEVDGEKDKDEDEDEDEDGEIEDLGEEEELEEEEEFFVSLFDKIVDERHQAKERNSESVSSKFGCNELFAKDEVVSILSPELKRKKRSVMDEEEMEEVKQKRRKRTLTLLGCWSCISLLYIWRKVHAFFMSMRLVVAYLFRSYCWFWIFQIVLICMSYMGTLSDSEDLQTGNSSSETSDRKDILFFLRMISLVHIEVLIVLDFVIICIFVVGLNNREGVLDPNELKIRLSLYLYDRFVVRRFCLFFCGVVQFFIFVCSWTYLIAVNFGIIYFQIEEKVGSGSKNNDFWSAVLTQFVGVNIDTIESDFVVSDGNYFTNSRIDVIRRIAHTLIVVCEEKLLLCFFVPILYMWWRLFEPLQYDSDGIIFGGRNLRQLIRKLKVLYGLRKKRKIPKRLFPNVAFLSSSGVSTSLRRVIRDEYDEKVLKDETEKGSFCCCCGLGSFIVDFLNFLCVCGRVVNKREEKNNVSVVNEQLFVPLSMYRFEEIEYGLEVRKIKRFLKKREKDNTNSNDHDNLRKKMKRRSVSSITTVGGMFGDTNLKDLRNEVEIDERMKEYILKYHCGKSKKATILQKMRERNEYKNVYLGVLEQCTEAELDFLIYFFFGKREGATSIGNVVYYKGGKEREKMLFSKDEEDLDNVVNEYKDLMYFGSPYSMSWIFSLFCGGMWEMIQFFSQVSKKEVAKRTKKLRDERQDLKDKLKNFESFLEERRKKRAQEAKLRAEIKEKRMLRRQSSSAWFGNNMLAIPGSRKRSRSISSPPSPRPSDLRKWRKKKFGPKKKSKLASAFSSNFDPSEMMISIGESADSSGNTDDIVVGVNVSGLEKHNSEKIMIKIEKPSPPKIEEEEEEEEENEKEKEEKDEDKKELVDSIPIEFNDLVGEIDFSEIEALSKEEEKEKDTEPQQQEKIIEEEEEEKEEEEEEKSQHRDEELDREEEREGEDEDEEEARELEEEEEDYEKEREEEMMEEEKQERKIPKMSITVVRPRRSSNRQVINMDEEEEEQESPYRSDEDEGQITPVDEGGITPVDVYMDRAKVNKDRQRAVERFKKMRKRKVEMFGDDDDEDEDSGSGDDVAILDDDDDDDDVLTNDSVGGDDIEMEAFEKFSA